MPPLDPRHARLRSDSLRASMAQARLEGQWAPVRSPEPEKGSEDRERREGLLRSMGVQASMRPRAGADPSRRWGLSQDFPGALAAGGGVRSARRPGRPAGWEMEEGPAKSGMVPRVPTQVVDVYLSAGLHENYRETDYHSCNADNDSNCNLYRVRLRLWADTVVPLEIEQIIASTGEGDARQGVVQPAVSPSGNRLAFIVRDTDSSTLYTVDMETGGVGIPDWGVSHSRPQFPNWYGEETFLYHKGDRDECTLYSNEIVGEDMGWLLFSSRRALLGSDASVSRETSFADANTNRAAEPGSLTSGPPKSVTTFGVSTTHGTREAPRVHALSPWPLSSTEVATEEFVLGRNLAGAPIFECHHPAWNVSGDSILCTAHDPTERYPATSGLPEAARDRRSRLLYMFTKSGLHWSGADVPFTPLFPVELNTNFGDRFPLAGSPSCHIYTYKYAEWCGTDDYIVATLFCSSDYLEDPIFSSRVFLIRRSDDKPQYYDITRMIELELGLSAGELHGIYSTCSRVGDLQQ